MIKGCAAKCMVKGSADQSQLLVGQGCHSHTFKMQRTQRECSWHGRDKHNNNSKRITLFPKG